MPKPNTPLVAADTIIELSGHDGAVVLIERRNPPYGWALPGGFVDPGETVEQAAAREALEETGLEVRLEVLLGCYSDPGRDPRGPVVSLVFAGTAAGTPTARDDARRVAIVDPASPGVTLAFDHARILADYLRYCATGRAPGWTPQRR